MADAAVATPAAEAPTPTTTATTTATPADSRRRRLSYTPELDGIRGLALLIVVVHHLGVLMWADKPSWFFPGGQVGVDLFFALSGFLITVMLLGEHDRTGGLRIGGFLWRRLLRLMPALIVFMAGLTLAALVTDRYTPRQMLSSSAWVLTFATNIGVDKVIVEVGHTWSLGVEAHFYLLWGLVVAGVVAVVKRPHAWLAATAAAGIVAVFVARATAFTDDGGVTAFDLYVDTMYRIDAPLVGALAGVAWAAGWLNKVPPKLAGWAAALSLAGVAALRREDHAALADPVPGALHRGRRLRGGAGGGGPAQRPEPDAAAAGAPTAGRHRDDLLLGLPVAPAGDDGARPQRHRLAAGPADGRGDRRDRCAQRPVVPVRRAALPAEQGQSDGVSTEAPDVEAPSGPEEAGRAGRTGRARRRRGRRRRPGAGAEARRPPPRRAVPTPRRPTACPPATAAGCGGPGPS